MKDPRIETHPPMVWLERGRAMAREDAAAGRPLDPASVARRAWEKYGDEVEPHLYDLARGYATSADV